MRTSVYFLFFGICCCWAACQAPDPPLFEQLPTTHTGIDFANKLVENDTHNILNFTNLYTGSGVGIGDFNRDGQPDVFLGGNQESSRLYLNEGDFKFRDVTEAAGLTTDRWITGVAVVDINADGWDDLYLCVSGAAELAQRSNLLFVNQQDNTFTEEAAAYGLDLAVQCTQANFLDYDKDGDLDVFVAVNPTDYQIYNVNNIRAKKVKGEAASTDILLRNNRIHPLDSSYTKPFTDVSAAAGILIEGYSLGLSTSDLNADGWPDIYVTNDFLTNDILYINNHDGTFTDRAAEMLRHTSFASMGIDVADINNDGHPEIYVLDMFPEDNYRQKMIMGGGNYDRFRYMLQAGYQAQYSRNTLQLNNGNGTYSEIGQLAEVHKTDWSWSALLADYDNDGLRDLFVTNGFRRDLGDLDYINYSNTNPFGDPEAKRRDHLQRILEQPGAALSNYVFKNKNGLQFSDRSAAWGLDAAGYSHGAAYADFDGDGDLDLIVNNVGQPSLVYRNHARERGLGNYLTVTLKAPQIMGAEVVLYFGEERRYATVNPYRGYLSSVSTELHFGLGKIETVDSIHVIWPDGKVSKRYAIEANEQLTVSAEGSEPEGEQNEAQAERFFQAAELPGVAPFRHQEDFQVDFKSQSLLPHQHSRLGPCFATGDVNGDGLEDLFVGGAAGFAGRFYLQMKDGSFRIESLPFDQEKEDVAALLIDVDGDADLDLYVVSGGVISTSDPAIYQDRLYRNEFGTFQSVPLPTMPVSGGCISAADYDDDGDLDLFLGGRVSPRAYPLPISSYLLENRGGTFELAGPAAFTELGMVSAAEWADIDGDGDVDLIIAGEFMPITIFKNNEGRLVREAVTVPASSGWWNTLAAGDFDEDGDVDFLAGNLGLNTNYRASVEEPMCIYAKDFDENGSLDPVLCQFVDGVEYPVVARDKLIAQIPPMKRRFPDYKAYASASIDELFKRPELTDVMVLEAELLTSSLLENDGNGNFTISVLPPALQFAPINHFLVDDYNHDGHLDALVVGNSNAAEVATGYYDAFTGGLMLGDGQGNFTVLKGAESGFSAMKMARSIARLPRGERSLWFIVGNNDDQWQVFEQKNFNLLDL